MGMSGITPNKSPMVSPRNHHHRLPLVPKYEAPPVDHDDDSDDDQGLLDLTVKASPIPKHQQLTSAIREGSHHVIKSPAARKLLLSPGNLLRSPVTSLLGAEDLSPAGGISRKRASPYQTPDQQPIRKSISTGRLNKSQVQILIFNLHYCIPLNFS